MLSRLQKISCLLLVCILTLTSCTLARPATPSEDPEATATAGEEPPRESEPEEEIPPRLSVRREDGGHVLYISGSGGFFRPSDALTRAEAASMFYMLLVDPPDDRAEIADVPQDAWFYDCVSLLAAEGVIEYEGELVHPHEPLSRGEFFAMVTRLVPAPSGKGEPSEFRDLDGSHKYYDEITAASAYGWIQDSSAGEVAPNAEITRAEAVVVINRALGRSCDGAAVDEIILSPYHDVDRSHWAYYDILEASLTHKATGDGGHETWTELDDTPLRLPGGLYWPNGDSLDFYCIDPETGFPILDGYYGTFYFGPDGRYTSGDAEIDEYAKEALSGIISSDMTREQKLRAAFNYTRDSFTYVGRNIYEMGDVSWGLEEARTMFATKHGNCYCYAGVFYVLARQLGYDAVLISGKVNNNNPVPHGWVEIEFDGKFYMYDTQLEKQYRLQDVYYYDFYHMAYEDVPWRYYR